MAFRNGQWYKFHVEGTEQKKLLRHLGAFETTDGFFLAIFTLRPFDSIQGLRVEDLEAAGVKPTTKYKVKPQLPALMVVNDRGDNVEGEDAEGKVYTVCFTPNFVRDLQPLTQLHDLPTHYMPAEGWTPRP